MQQLPAKRKRLGLKLRGRGRIFLSHDQYSTGTFKFSASGLLSRASAGSGGKVKLVVGHSDYEGSGRLSPCEGENQIPDRVLSRI